MSSIDNQELEEMDDGTIESLKDQCVVLQRQHITDEAIVQELNDRLEQCYEEITLVKNENSQLQNQISEKSAMKLQLDDYKISNGDLVNELGKARLTISKMKTMAKNASDLENALNEKESENAKLKDEILQMEKIITENQDAKQKYRKEYQEKIRFQTENKTLQNLNVQLQAAIEKMKQERRKSLLPRLNDTAEMSFEAMPSLAAELMAAEGLPSNDEMEELKKEKDEMISKIDNYEIGEKVMQEQLNSQVEEITKQKNDLREVQLKLQNKSEQLDSWKAMFQKLKYESEAKNDDVVHEHRQEFGKMKADLNEKLFIAKKDCLDKENIIKKLERTVAAQKKQMESSPPRDISLTIRTPVVSKRVPKTPSNIPRLLTPKKSYSKDVDDARLEEMSKRNQAAPPHLRSTYPTEVQYYEKPLNLESTGRITRGALHCSTAHKSSSAFEVPNSPKTRTRRRDAVQESQKKATSNADKKENNSSELLQFSPPKRKYLKRRKLT